MHRYFHARQFSDLHFSLIITTTGSRSSQEEPDTPSRPLYAGHRLRTRRLIPKAGRPFGFDVSHWFTTRQHGFGFTRLMSTLPAEFSLTLYFIAHYHGSLPQQPGLFGTDFRQQIPVGLPPSLHKLMLITCKTSRFASLCLRHTGDLSLMRDILTIEH